MQVAFRVPSALTRPLSRAICQRRSLNLVFRSSKPVLFNPRSNVFRQGTPAGFSTSLPPRQEHKEDQVEVSSSSKTAKPSIRENIYTIPNILTVSRIFATPVLGWAILEGNYQLATGLLAYAGLTDLVRLPFLRELNWLIWF